MEYSNIWIIQIMLIRILLESDDPVSLKDEYSHWLT